MFSFSQVDQLVNALKVGGIRDVSTDPAELLLPGVLVQPQAVAAEVLIGHRIRIQLALIGQAVTPSRALGQLADLFVKVEAVVGAADEARTATMLMPDGVAYPCLLYPVDLYTEPASNAVNND